MKASELSSRVGQTVLVSFESVEIECSIVDAKASYGRIRFLVSPKAGVGSQWVEEQRIRFEARKPLPQWVLDRLQADEAEPQINDKDLQAEILRVRGGK